MRKIWTVLGVLTIAGGLLLAGCGNGDFEELDEFDEMPEEDQGFEDDFGGDEEF